MGLVAEFRSILRQSTFTSALDGRSFVRFSPVAEWLTTLTNRDTALTRRIDDIHSLLCPKKKNLEYSNVQNADIQIKSFCILFTIGCLEILDILSPYTLLDRDLPLSMRMLQELAPKDASDRFTSFINDFFEAQWSFCPATFDLSKDKTLKSEFVIPISSMKIIGAGRTACIYEVTVSEEFLEPSLADSLSFSRSRDIDDAVGSDFQLVLKAYETNMTDIGHNEASVYELLKGNHNFLSYVCNFNNAGRLNILLEKGQEDLDEFFATQSPPVLQKEISNFWYALSDIVEGIENIHETRIEVADGRGESSVVGYSGWHGDIKPSNILKVRDRWKLIDFGFTSITTENEKAVLPRGKPLSYTPPEARPTNNHQEKSFMRASDIWSLGCVFSIASTWVVLGNEGIAKYTAYRIKATQEACNQSTSTSLNGDFFHDHSKVLNEVTQWHEFLREHVRKSDSITGEVLNMVDELMFVKWEDRGCAKELRRRLVRCCSRFVGVEGHSCDWDEWGDILDGLDWKEYQFRTKGNR